MKTLLGLMIAAFVMAAEVSAIETSTYGNGNYGLGKYSLDLRFSESHYSSTRAVRSPYGVMRHDLWHAPIKQPKQEKSAPTEVTSSYFFDAPEVVNDNPWE